jgi:DNA-binding transcriptional ArsR family regulator
MDMARQSVSKHLAVLEAAGLVSTVRQGREKLHYLNPAPIGEIYGRRSPSRPSPSATGALRSKLTGSQARL